MRDVELYRHLLGLETPWTVHSVELNVPGQRVDVWAGHAEAVRWPCPECRTPLGLYDHSEERVWRHLDSCQFMTYLHAQPPPGPMPDPRGPASPPAVGGSAGAVHRPL
jgi:transposase